ncbi:MAG: hypothetical protein ACLUE2_15795 [Bacteroides cellulosilyticus]
MTNREQFKGKSYLCEINNKQCEQARIYIEALGINERNKQLSTDTWYLNFANQLLSLIDESPLYSKKFEAEKVDAALSLAVYLQDAIA